MRPYHNKRAGGVAKGVGPEFKSQYCQKKKKKRKKEKDNDNQFCYALTSKNKYSTVALRNTGWLDLLTSHHTCTQ
jgi:hypothetical protein